MSIKNVFAFLLMGIASASFAPEKCSAMADPEASSSRSEIRLSNPCYPGCSDINEIKLTNGSMVCFAAKGRIGKIIRYASTYNTVDNPLGLSHSGLLLLSNPRDVLQMIENSPNTADRAKKAMTESLLQYYRAEISIENFSGVAPFLLEATGTVKQALGLIYPHVQISPFKKVLEEYSGNIYLRSALYDVPTDFSDKFIRDHIGRPYETAGTLIEVLKAVRGANKEERTQNVFSSELCGLFYRSAINDLWTRNSTLSGESLNGLLDLYVNVSNIIPEQFGTGAGANDLLKGLAEPELALKSYFDYIDDDAKIGCCGCFL
ncbi:MAG: hypothetical protein LBO73_02670 [Holosporaceae bacterium]|nr:hypothetical protein [Holosporaceae bacterium]